MSEDNLEDISPNNTYIAIEEADGFVDYEKAKRLKRYNKNEIKARGIVNRDKKAEKYTYVTLDAVATTLRLTDSQKDRAHDIMEDIESKGRGVVQLSFAVCVIVANEDVEGKRYWVEKEDNDERFEDFVEENDISPLPAINQVRQEVDYV